MKRRKKGLALLMALVVCVCSTITSFASVVPLRNPAYDHERYIALTTLAGKDIDYRNAVQVSASSMGYSTASWEKYPAIDIYNNLPYNAINILHGHGAPGMLRCEYGSTWSGFYAYDVTPQNKDACMYDYIPTALERTKIIVFLACNSATITNGWSMATIAYNRGAKFSLGFINEVAGAGEWNQYLMRGLAMGKTIQQGLDYADQIYHNAHLDGSYDSPNSPIGHHWHYGQSNVKIKL